MAVHLVPEKYLGRVVEVIFVDHVSSGNKNTELVLCRVWGKIISETWQKVVICTWASDVDENSEYVTLIRSAIHSIKPLTFDLGEK